MNTAPQIKEEKNAIVSWPEWAINPQNTKVRVAMFTRRVLEIYNIQMTASYLPK